MYRIMVVEDDEILRQTFRDVLKADGFEVFLCPDGASGLREVKTCRPDLILLDVNLPDMSGFDVCRGLKADPISKSVPVIILTGHARDVTERVRGLDVGAEDYLFKPVSPRVLIARIRSILKVSLRPS
ncbi:MAG TPA: response regulator [Elusimicrobiota bacterium]|nr:response regulator [Elusimicrobiota bacterium]